MNRLALQILAEIPHGVSRRVSAALRNDESLSNQDIAQGVITDLTEPQIWAIALSALTIDAARQRRSLVRAREQAAAGVEPTKHYKAQATREANESRRVAGVVKFNLPPDTTMADVLGHQIQLALAAMNRRERAIQITADLLESSFSVAGEMVSWGDATADQHRARAASLYRSAQGVIETAKLHEDAVAMLTDAGVDSLRELLRLVRAA